MAQANRARRASGSPPALAVCASGYFLDAGVFEGSGVWGVIFEAGVVVDVGELGGVGWPVTLLGDDHLGDARLFAFLALVDFLAIDERDHIGVLLDSA